MANTDLITAARREIFVGDIAENRPNSEAVMRKLAGNINFILQSQLKKETFSYPGFFCPSASDIDRGIGGFVYVKQQAAVEDYTLYVRESGSTGTTTFNVAIYDNTGAFVNNLFGIGANALQISGNSGTDVVIGRANLSTTSDIIAINTAGHTVQQGVLNLSVLEAGYVLIPFIEDAAQNALNLHFTMNLREG